MPRLFNRPGEWNSNVRHRIRVNVIRSNQRLRNNLARANKYNLPSSELSKILQHATGVFHRRGKILAMPKRPDIAFRKLMEAYWDM